MVTEKGNSESLWFLNKKMPIKLVFLEVYSPKNKRGKTNQLGEYWRHTPMTWRRKGERLVKGQCSTNLDNHPETRGKGEKRSRRWTGISSLSVKINWVKRNSQEEASTRINPTWNVQHTFRDSGLSPQPKVWWLLNILTEFSKIYRILFTKLGHLSSTCSHWYI